MRWKMKNGIKIGQENEREIEKTCMFQYKRKGLEQSKPDCIIKRKWAVCIWKHRIYEVFIMKKL